MPRNNATIFNTRILVICSCFVFSGFIFFFCKYGENFENFKLSYVYVQIDLLLYAKQTNPTKTQWATDIGMLRIIRESSNCSE